MSLAFPLSTMEQRKTPRQSVPNTFESSDTDPCSVYVSAHEEAVVELMLLYVPPLQKVPFGVDAICSAQFSTIAMDGIAPINGKILGHSFPSFLHLHFHTYVHTYVPHSATISNIVKSEKPKS